MPGIVLRKICPSNRASSAGIRDNGSPPGNLALIIQAPVSPPWILSRSKRAGVDFGAIGQAPAAAAAGTSVERERAGSLPA